MATQDLSIKIDIDRLFMDSADFDGDPVDLKTAMRDAVVQAAAAQLISTFDHEELHELRQEVHRKRNELVMKRLAAEVDAALSQPIQRTTQWGEKRGEATSVRELIRIELEAFLNGTHTNRRRDDYDKTPRTLAELIGNVANETMRNDLAGVVRDAKKAVDAKVQEILLDAVTKKLAGGK